MLEIGAFADELLEFRIQRVRHHQAFGAAVGQHEAVVVLGQQRVDRHGDDAGLEAAEKRGRPVDGVGQRQQHALFALDAERAQHRAEARDAVGELAVGAACRAHRYRPACWRGRPRDCFAARRRRNCSRVGLRPRDRPRLGSMRACFGDCHCFSSQDDAYYARKAWPAKRSILPQRSREPRRMIFSRDRILTTHVGSLPRNEKLSDLLVRAGGRREIRRRRDGRRNGQGGRAMSSRSRRPPASTSAMTASSSASASRPTCRSA